MSIFGNLLTTDQRQAILKCPALQVFIMMVICQPFGESERNGRKCVDMSVMFVFDQLFLEFHSIWSGV
jgi:hypothetical protein